jgi:hypothetical protein
VPQDAANSFFNSYFKELHGWTLGNIAREAKERLDEKFRSQRASVIKR